jgi:hypothetical protein
VLGTAAAGRGGGARGSALVVSTFIVSSCFDSAVASERRGMSALSRRKMLREGNDKK